MLHYLGFEVDDETLSYKMAITDADGSGRIEKVRALHPHCMSLSATKTRMHHQLYNHMFRTSSWR